ncbi:hypothetical protein [Deinococcus aluminii]|uniref:MarR family transcriptional regulator n=1 Tax=Deinococcus aluminii TaxID=1656885 RepID=A0ABP9XGB6_9DEIO
MHTATPEVHDEHQEALLQRGAHFARHRFLRGGPGRFSAPEFRRALAITREEGDRLLNELQRQGLVSRVPGIVLPIYEAPDAR